MFIRFFIPMLEVADVRELPDEGMVLGDVNLKGDRIKGAGVPRKGGG
jgi:hypothetical protein